MRPDAIEEHLRAAVAELLRTDPERVDVTRSLISLGFDSLMAVNLQYQIQTTLGLSLSVADLLAGFSTRQIAESLAASTVDDERPALVPRDRPERLPLSFAQQRLWFLDQLTPGAYTVAGAVRLTGALDVDALAASLTDVVARHEALRTVFPVADGQPYQRVLPAGPVPLPVTDLSAIAPQRAAAQAEVVAQQQIELPFDLATGPVLRARLVRLATTVHELIVTVHHIACDGASMTAMMDELAGNYERRLTGEPGESPAPAVQYADYTLWQRDWLTGPEHARQLEFWRERLAGAPPALDLPTDRPRPNAPGTAGGTYQQTLPPRLTDALHALAREADATLFMTMEAAFAALLARLSGQHDVVVGTPIANRADPALEPLIGFFVNTLAIRTDVSDDPGFRTLLARTRDTTLAAYQHQDLPFEHLVDALGLGRELGRNPLFQVMFTLRNSAPPRYKLPDRDGGRLLAVPRELDTGTAKFDLTLTVQHDDDDNLRARWEYRSDLFDESTVARIAGYYQTLLERIVADPDRPISTLSLLSLEQRHEQLNIWNAGLNPADGTLAHDLITLAARAAPDAIALVSGEREVTYAELVAGADALAGELRRRGIGPDVLVGLCAQRGPELVTGLLAILKAGGAYLPLDPTYPRARLTQILADAAPPVILTQSHLADQFQGQPAEVILLEDPVPADPMVEARTQPQNLAYVLYTSGSTGRPKGVAVTHANLSGFLAAMDGLFGLKPQTWLALTSTAFDISVLELIWTLSAGHRVVLLDETTADVGAAVKRHGVTHLQATPSFASRLLDEAAPALSTLDTLMLGGEAFSATLVRQLKELTTTKVINGYGPTEATVYATTHRVRPDEEDIPIGRPLPGVRAYILDKHAEPVPVGVTGELYLAGHGIARGYLNRPGLTAERFLPNPHGLPGGVMYRTGDLARYRADGTIEFLGRTDHQVKIRGYRIELDEIDAVLTQHAAVRAAVTVARDGQLVSYVVTEERHLADVRAQLRRRLPTWMHPTHLVPLDELPLTPNNKIDRSRLPEPSGPQARAEPVRPSTPAELTVAGIWAEILGRSDIGVHDNFFDLGGHSLLATQAVAHLRRAAGVELPLRSIFEHPTIAELAALIGGDDTEPEARPVLRRAARTERVPLSFAQQRLWFLEQLAPDTVYAIAGTVSLTGPLDRDRLAGALSAIVARHEALRTVFEVHDGTPYQRVRDPEPVRLPVTDLAGRSVAELGEITRREATTPFDLAAGPLLRARLVRVAEQRHLLVVAVHHIACDGWSLSLMLDELAAHYRGEPAPPLPVQYADYTLWQRDWLTGAHLQEQLDFWRERLAGAPPALELPADRPRPAIPSYAGASYWQELPAGLSEAVRALARAGDATLFMALSAAFSTLLWRLSGQDDVVVGTPIANRADPALEPLIGFFVNTLALRTDLSGNPTFRTLLARTRETTLAAYQHQDLPFEYLVERLQLVRDVTRNPLFQVMFTVQHATLPAHTLPDLELRAAELETGVAKFDLTLTVQHEPDGSLRARWEYSRDLFDEPTVARIARCYRTLLEGIVAEPDRPLGTLPLLAGEERHALLDQPLPDPEPVLVTERIAATATENPDGVALVAEGVALTYAELTGRADALAARLRARGVGPDVLVGLCAGRGPELIVGLLAILRAGGAYLPLDPGYPTARLKQILTDAQPGLLLTQRRLLADLPAHDAETILLEDPVPRPAEPLPPARLHPDHLAYVIYTSGSTGTPKGVAVSHGNLAASTAARDRVYHRPVRGFVLLSSVAFDTSVASLFWSLCRGATLHLPADGRQLELDHLTGLLRRRDVSHLVCLPSLYQLLVERAGDPSVGLETVVVAGEPVPPALVDRHHELLPDVPLYNEYGPTEATVWSTVALCRPGEARVPIGRAIPGWQVYIVDAYGEPVPPGVAGELCLSGHGIVRGYLNRPGLTAERFLPNPHGEPGSRLYRTGDLARFRPDGQIEFLGRTDHQVKIRGYRIELDEIDAVLAQHPDVQSAVTVARDQQLVSYVVTEEHSLPSIREHLRQHLPSWMHPAHLVPLGELPLTPNNKIDRGRLPAPRPTDRAAPGFQEPSTPVEVRIAEVWKSLLHLEAVGLDENFFELGGHSLLLVKAHEQLQPLHEGLRIVDLFRYPTVRTLATYLTEGSTVDDADDGMQRQRRAGRARQQERRRRLRGSPT